MQTWIWIFRFLCAALAILAAVLLYRALLHDRSRGRRRCPRCWYDLAGVPGLTCPECGKQARRERSLFRTRRYYRRASLGALLVFMSYVSAIAPRTIASGNWWSNVPTPVLVFIFQFYDDAGEQLFKTSTTGLTGTQTLTQWERLLLAHTCARVLQEPDPPPSAPSVQAAAGAGALLQFQYAGPAPRKSWAMWQLQSLGPDARPAIPAVNRLLKSADPATRESAVRLLGHLAPANQTLPALSIAMSDSEASVRRAAIAALQEVISASEPAPGMFGKRKSSRANVASTSIRLIAGRLTDSNREVRLAAAAALGQYGPPDEALVAPLADSVFDPDLSTSHTGVVAIAKFDNAGVAALIRLLNHPDGQIRLSALSWIGQQDHDAPAAVPRLQQLLTDPNQETRVSVTLALSRIGPPAHAALPDLARIRAEDPSDHLHLLAVLAASSIAAHTDAAVPLFIEALTDKDPKVRRVAAESLQKLGPVAAPAADALRSRITDPDPEVRSAATEALLLIRNREERSP